MGKKEETIRIRSKNEREKEEGGGKPKRGDRMRDWVGLIQNKVSRGEVKR